MPGHDPFTAAERYSPSGWALARAVFFFALAQVTRVVDALSLVGHRRLLRAYLASGRDELLTSPYEDRGFARVDAARRAQQSQVELTYGETSVVVARRVLRRAGVGPGSRVVDLGCGRGRVLFAAASLGAEALGVDLLPGHVRAIERAVGPAGIHVEVGDAARVSLTGATHVYVTWTCMTDETRRRVTENLRTLALGARVIAISHPVLGPGFVERDQRRALFSWGPATVYVAERVEEGGGHVAAVSHGEAGAAPSSS